MDAKTIKQYFQILEDTLIGYHVYPFKVRSGRKDIVSAPKFYLFDVGVANFLAKRRIESLKGSEAGKAFEHLVFMELLACKTYENRRDELFYWRTQTGLEVDFVINQGLTAVEVKISDNVSRKDLHGMDAFLKENTKAKGIVVCPQARKRKIELTHGPVTVLSWTDFLEMLWKPS